MRKSVLVIDTSETCLDCRFCYELDEGIEAYCSVMDDDKDNGLMKQIECEDGYCQGKPEWCPLKPLLEKDDFDDPYDEYYTGYRDGWNRCLEKIVGE